MVAKYVFLGLDANFAINVETQVPEIVSYLKDGPAFWRNTGSHHPFVLDTYSGSGGLYHENFKLIEFKPTEAGQVSFIELIEKPTTGRNKLTDKDLCQSHINRLRDIFNKGAAKYIFIPPAAIKLLKKKEEFHWLCAAPLRNEGDLIVLSKNTERGQIVFEMYHLSNYGKYDARLKRQIKQVKEIVVSERKAV